MIIQRKIMLDDDLCSEYAGMEMWEDIEVPSLYPTHNVLKWLATLPDSVGTEYRITHGFVSTAVMGERNNICYVDWKQDS